jgi:hypothetical protein
MPFFELAENILNNRNQLISVQIKIKLSSSLNVSQMHMHFEMKIKMGLEEIIQQFVPVYL